MSNYVVVIRSTPEHDFHVLPVAEEIDKKRKQNTIVKHTVIVLAVLYRMIKALHHGSLW
jgi:hypothetical protein